MPPTLTPSLPLSHLPPRAASFSSASRLRLVPSEDLHDILHTRPMSPNDHDEDSDVERAS
jgi:hypothetical protein